MSSPILVLPKPNLSYPVDTDALFYIIGCSLFEIRNDEKTKTNWNLSRTLNPAKLSYSE